MSWTRKVQTIFKDESLRNRVLFLLGALLVFRLLAAIPVPGIDQLRIQQFFASNQFLGLLNIFSGGGLSSLSIVMLGVGPYITASIIMQLSTVMFPRLKAMYHEEGEIGRRKFTQYSRLLTVPLAMIQAFSFLLLLERQGIIINLTLFETLVNIIIITAGSVLLTWIGELINEFGIGNGVSIIIFAGIIASLPTAVSQLVFTYDPTLIPTYIAFVAAAVAIILGVVVVTEAERPIPITHSRQVRGGQSVSTATSFMPLRLNQAGVMPIIFALSILLFPQMLLNLFANTVTGTGADINRILNEFFLNLPLYALVYFLLVFVFTFFYTAITFDVEATATNLQKSGAYITGVRPGSQTEEHIGNILSRVTFIGAVFLGVIAILPIVMQSLTGIQTLAIGGTALLIVVAVVIDLIKRVEAQVAMRQYNL